MENCKGGHKHGDELGFKDCRSFTRHVSMLSYASFRHQARVEPRICHVSFGKQTYSVLRRPGWDQCLRHRSPAMVGWSMSIGKEYVRSVNDAKTPSPSNVATHAVVDGHTRLC